MTDAVPAATIEQHRNEALLGWYGSAARQLPWRGSPNPYVILVSEVMLQQTQVDRVVPYFERFVERFPTVEALAGASLRDVLEAWTGLGYNKRAQRLHAAARVISVAGWPETADGFRGLPGIGPYTASAIACFAFGEAAVPVDTNLRRVLSRWHGETLGGKILDLIATEDRAEADTAAWTQAVMDLSAAICRPRGPKCERCPVSSWCTGPDAYQPPRPQPRFEGSVRQLRGAIIRNLVQGSASGDTLAKHTGFPIVAVLAVLEDLSNEGLVEAEGAKFRLPG